jgi:hypothetical protein
MEGEKWDQMLDFGTNIGSFFKTDGKSELNKQRKREEVIVNAYASKNGLNYKTAERTLADAKKIFKRAMSIVTITQSERNGISRDDVVKKAIREFKHIPVKKIVIKGDPFNALYVSPYLKGHRVGGEDFGVLREVFKNSQDHFLIDGKYIGGANGTLEFNFSYRS